jgi:hypothetical protein
MRWLVLLLLAGVADAKPPRPREIQDPFYDEDTTNACERHKYWEGVKTCLERSGTLTILHEADGAKLVRMSFASMRDHAVIYLYARRADKWWRGNLYTTLNPTTELLSFSKLDGGYRIDIGTIARTSAIFDGVSAQRVVLQRRNSTVCDGQGTNCRTLMTACDAYVGGKAYWSFRGTIAFSGKTAMLAGDTSRGGRLCTPPKSVMVVTQ